MRRIADAVADATVVVSEEHTTSVVNCDFIEVEKVSIVVTAASQPNAGCTLHRIVRTGIHNGPTVAAIEGGGHKGIPDARERRALEITRPISAEETYGSAIVVTSDCFGKGSILDSVRRAEVGIFRPRRSVISADLDANVAFSRILRVRCLIRYVEKIDRIVRPYCN